MTNPKRTTPSSLSDSALRRLAKRRGYTLHKHHDEDTGVQMWEACTESGESVHIATKYQTEQWLRTILPLERTDDPA